MDMNRQLPLVSVVIATYNMGRYLPETINSVLAQTYSPLEIIVVDDGSTDGTGDIVARWQEDVRFRYIQQSNLGQQAAKNRGVAEASGEFIAFLDADDRWQPTKLERQIPLFEGGAVVGVVYTGTALIDEHGHGIGRRSVACPQGWVTEALLKENFVSFSGAVVSRQALDRCGPFDESLSMSIDYDLWLRISTEFEFRYVDEPLLEYRIWPGQMSHKMVKRTGCILRILEKFERDHAGLVSPDAMARARSSTLVSRGFARMAAGEGRLAAMREMVHAIYIDLRYMSAWKGVAKIVLGRTR